MMAKKRFLGVNTDSPNRYNRLYYLYLCMALIITIIACDDSQLNQTLTNHQPNMMEDELAPKRDISEVSKLSTLKESGVTTGQVKGTQKYTPYSHVIKSLLDETEQLPWQVDLRVLYQDRIYDAEGYEGEHITRPASHIHVKIIKEVSLKTDRVDEIIMDQGYVNDEGNIRLKWFDWPPNHNENDKLVREVRYRIVASSRQKTSYGDEAEVSSREDHSLYQLEAFLPLSTFQRSHKEAMWSPTLMVKSPSMTLTATEEGVLSGAFNILNATAVGFDLLHQHSDKTGPKLTIQWDLDQAVSCGSCYSANMIRLGGQVEDPDHYDDHIILHEMGHFFTDRWSVDDSPGGPHRGRAVHPSLAYGEGVAYFWAALALQDPVIVDWMFPQPWVVDLESSLFNGEPMTWGLFTPVAAQPELVHLSAIHHEELVSSLLWSFYAWSEDNSDINGERLMMNAFLEQMPARDELGIDVGPIGIDMADYLDALSCEIAHLDYTREETWLNRLSALGFERSYEWSWHSDRDSACSLKSGLERLSLRMHKEAGSRDLVIDPLKTENGDFNEQLTYWTAWSGRPPELFFLDEGQCLTLPCTLRSPKISEAIDKHGEFPIIVELHTHQVQESRKRYGSWYSIAAKEYTLSRTTRSMDYEQRVIKERGILSFDQSSFFK